jgi:hypothetical protein
MDFVSWGTTRIADERKTGGEQVVAKLTNASPARLLSQEKLKNSMRETGGNWSVYAACFNLHCLGHPSSDCFDHSQKQTIRASILSLGGS